MDAIKWIREAVKKIEQGEKLLDIHLDEVTTLPEANDLKTLFDISIENFNQIYFEYNKRSLKNTRIQLDIELEWSKTIKGVPLNLETLIDSIDLFQMPEYKIYQKEGVSFSDIPTLEYYHSPLPFKITGLDENIKTIYTTYRSIEELKLEEEFMRWFTLIFET